MISISSCHFVHYLIGIKIIPMNPYVKFLKLELMNNNGGKLNVGFIENLKLFGLD